MSILEIKSIRVRSVHFTIEAGKPPQEQAKLVQHAFASINKAKAHSRALGGAKAVRAFRSKAEAYAFLRSWEREKANG